MSAAYFTEPSAPFAARYPGWCAKQNCDTPIEVGEMIIRLPSRSGRYIHVECPDSESVADKPAEPLCGRCNLYHKGECL